MKDNYPTRKESNFRIIERLTPCAYSKPDLLSEEQFSKYLEDGYLLVRGFYNSHIIAALKKQAESIFNGETSCYTNKEPKSNKIRSALNVSCIEGIKNALSPELVSIARALLNDSVYLHQSRINFKAGKDANGWNWHSDFETWHAKDGMGGMDCFTAIVPIEDNTADNGCIKFVPKSHTKFVSCPAVGAVDADKEFSEQTEGVPSSELIEQLCIDLQSGVIEVPCEAGDLVLFDCNLLHSSGGNNTDGKRTNLYFVFNALKNKLQNPFSGSSHRPEQMGATKITIL